MQEICALAPDGNQKTVSFIVLLPDLSPECFLVRKPLSLMPSSLKKSLSSFMISFCFL